MMIFYIHLKLVVPEIKRFGLCVIKQVSLWSNYWLGYDKDDKKG